jgi:hypothetical protein
MARLIFREFDAAKPTFVRRKFISNGRHYAVGDVFDWRRLSLTTRKAKQMFDSGHIGHQEAPVAVAPIVVAHEEPFVAVDDLDLIEDMKELRRIADAEGASYKVSKADQREAIRENRKETE